MAAFCCMAVTPGLTVDERLADCVLELQFPPDIDPRCEVLVGQDADARVTGLAMPLPAAERRERVLDLDRAPESAGSLELAALGRDARQEPDPEDSSRAVAEPVGDRGRPPRAL